jgi:hypothetical protein
MQFSSFQISTTTRDGVYNLQKCTRFSVALVPSVTRRVVFSVAVLLFQPRAADFSVAVLLFQPRAVDFSVAVPPQQLLLFQPRAVDFSEISSPENQRIPLIRLYHSRRA